MKKIIILIISSCILSSCISLSNQREGHVLKKGQVSVSGSTTYVTASENDFGVLDIMLNGGYGFGYNLQALFMVNLNSQAKLELDYQFIGSQESLFGASIGMCAQGQLINVQTGVGPQLFYGYEIPLALSLKPNHIFTMYGSVCYSYLTPYSGIASLEPYSFVYLTSGIKVGEKAGISLETNILANRLNKKLTPNFYLNNQQAYNFGIFYKF